MIAVLLLSGGGGEATASNGEGREHADEDGTQTPTKTETPRGRRPPRSRPPRTDGHARRRPTTPAPSGGRPTSPRRASSRSQGYNARQAGDYAKSLDLSQQALDACGNSNELDPCGYALFEKGLALNRSGKPDEAIPVLQERLDRFGDNEKGEVAKELKAAKKAAKG